ncbi:MAG: outer membrane beta-barrel protein [Acidobacteria bacterium]|nr:outer membrane beta-barrel protein [Acidobacteriota bacterium]MCI0724572.1 outer membrane beta-barrel protein [Acidobacteriota bacterium]
MQPIPEVQRSPNSELMHRLLRVQKERGTLRRLLFMSVAIPNLWSGLAQPSFAQIARGFELGAYGGTYSGRGAGGVRVLDRLRSREIRSEITDGSTFGFRGAYHFNSYVGIELDADGSTNDHIAQLFDLNTEAATEHTNALFFAFGNGVVHLLKGRFAPYLTAGAGGMGFVDQGSLAINYGGGLKLFITKRLALRLDAREIRIGLNGTLEQPLPPSRPGDPIRSFLEPFTDKLRFTSISGGFSVVF